MRVFLLRHGESVSNAAVDKVSLPEEEGDRLSPRGRRQAETAGRRIAEFGIERIVTSPMGRARETAAAVAAATGLEPEVWDWTYELREPPEYFRSSGEHQQRHRWSNRMKAHAEDPEAAPPGGESFADLRRRVVRTEERLVADDVDRTLLVGHGIFFRFAFALTVLGEDFTPADIDRLWRIGSLNCALSVFQHSRNDGSPNPADIDGWRCVSWMVPLVGPEDVTGTGGGGAGN
jgi:probable phosphoglycerate mutase